MSRFVRWSTCAYRGILVLYPFELRYEYGTEMAGVFAEDLEDAWQSRRIGNVIGVWWRATSEVLQIAVPGRFANQALVAPAVSLVLHLAILGSVLALATFAQEGIPHGILHGLVTLRPHGQ